MKKLMSFLTLLICTMGAMAQSWSNPHSNNPGGYTVINANFVVENSNDAVYLGNFTLAAFVGDECRWTESDNGSSMTTENSQTFLTIKVPGNYDNESDNGKSIKFYASDRFGNIYELKVSTNITYDQETTYGNPPSTNRINLTLTYPTTITFNSFEVNKGESINLLDQITVEPVGAALPQNYQWYLGNYSSYATIEGDVLTGVDFVKDAEIIMRCKDGNHVRIANTTFSVVNHATAINIVTDAITVFKDETTQLDLFMKNNYQFFAYSLTPTDATDNVQWEYDEEYIAIQNGKYVPIKGGTTQIRPYIVKSDQTKLYPADNKKISVTINVPISSFTSNWPANTEFICNVDDDIYNHIQQYISITPDNATDKTFTITGNNVAEYFNVTDGHIIALKATPSGSPVTITVKANNLGITDPTYTFDINVEILNQAKELTISSDPLILDSKITIEEAEQAIANYITWGPESSIPYPGYSTIEHVSGPIMVGKGNIDANGNVTLGITSPEGTLESVGGTETIIKVTIIYRDFSNWDGQGYQTITNTEITKQFTVKVVSGLEKFTVVVTPNESNPTVGTITVTPVPANAQFELANPQITVESSLYPTWQTIISVTKVEEAASGCSYTYTGLLPGDFKATFSSNGKSGEQTFTVPAVVNLANGWQWKSNPYGDITNTKDAKEAFFGTNFSEARTYDDLLFNDPNWGFYGTLNTKSIAQSQMYKVKMSGSQTSYITGGHPTTNNTSLELQPGWNWIGSPYLYDRKLENMFDLEGNLPNGVVIASKADGSAEISLSGNTRQWIGDLKLIKEGQGYLIYNPTSNVITTSFKVEVGSMAQGDETSAGARRRASHTTVWEYDHTRFANNMTMVVRMPDLKDSEQYTIGAFVNGECRGEGSFENGLGFITVHTDGGEQVTFRLYNELTGQYFDIDQTVQTQNRIGSLSAPMVMTSEQVVTGISELHQQNTGVAERYDLSGRKVIDSGKGVSLQRMSDGKVVKVVVK